MWEKIVLTAGTAAQNANFRVQLAEIHTEEYCESLEVVTDEVPRKYHKRSFLRPRKSICRIGSGGATLSIIRKSLEDPNFHEKSKCLLIHSGGLSQRMPHLSPYGKVFGCLPNGKTILETKLKIYQKQLFEKLPSTGGIMITASDVLEDMKSLSGEFQNSEADVLIFAHLSSVEVGTHHGVFVMDKATNQLKRVLQKPSIEEMRQEGAIRSDGMVLTDSCYFMTWKFCRKLLKNPLLRKPVNEELCCYGDFMRPMGEDPKIDYIQNCASGRSTYRKALADAFKTARVEIAELGLNSFFHFGTYQEFTEHLLPKSQFRAAFPNFYKSNIVRSRGFSNVPLSSFVEFSDGHGVQVGENCVVSCVRAPEFSGAKIPENTVVFGVIMEEERKFVTVMLDVREDIKKRWEIVKWNGHDTGIANASLWEAPIFEICETLEESLHKTLNEWGNGLKEISSLGRISIAEAVRRCGVKERSRLIL